MSDTCAMIGADLNPLNGSLPTTETKAERLRRRDVDVPAHKCALCFCRLSVTAERRFRPEILSKDEPPAEPLRHVAGKACRTEGRTCGPCQGESMPHPGWVSGHAIQDEGQPAFALPTPARFPGRKGEDCLRKFRPAGRNCLKSPCPEASEKGAPAVAGLSAGCGLLSTSRGMLMTYMPNAASAPLQILAVSP